MVVGVTAALIAVGFVGGPADAGPAIDSTGLVDRVAVSLDQGGARAVGDSGAFGPLASGDIHATDADLDTEAMTIQGTGVLGGASGPFTVEFDLCGPHPAFLAQIAFIVFGIQPAEHLEATGSMRAKAILDDWDAQLTKFVKVMPTDYKRALRELAAEAAEAAS